MATGTIKDPRNLKGGMKTYIGSRSTSISAYLYVDAILHLQTDIGMPANGVIMGFPVLCDRTQGLIVLPTSATGSNWTFRTYNPTSTTKTATGLVLIASYVYR